MQYTDHSIRLIPDTWKRGFAMVCRFLCTMLIAMGLSVEALGQIPDGFVLVRGEECDGGRVRVEDFEILDHTVTNPEYQAFVDATAHEPPLHWENG
jgi:hypothetical protein